MEVHATFESNLSNVGLSDPLHELDVLRVFGVDEVARHPDLQLVRVDPPVRLDDVLQGISSEEKSQDHGYCRLPSTANLLFFTYWVTLDRVGEGRGISLTFLTRSRISVEPNLTQQIYN